MQFRKIFIIFFLISFDLIANDNIEPKECGKIYSSLVFSEYKNKILTEKRADQRIYPASLTKLMTLYLAFEAIENKNLYKKQILTVSERVESISSINRITTLNLKKGDKITLYEAIIGSAVKSFNGTSIMIAEVISANEWNFVQKMNKKAEELNMIHTNFRNASGLHDNGQFTTGYDLAKLVISLKKRFPKYYNIFSIKKIKIYDKIYISHNHILFDYKGSEGIKTGFTSIAGSNLIAAVKRNNHRVFSILTSCESSEKRDEFTKALLDIAFLKIKNK